MWCSGRNTVKNRFCDSFVVWLGSPGRRGSFTGTQLGGLGSSPPRGEGSGPMAANFNIGSGSPKDEVAVRWVGPAWLEHVRFECSFRLLAALPLLLSVSVSCLSQLSVHFHFCLTFISASVCLDYLLTIISLFLKNKTCPSLSVSISVSMFVCLSVSLSCLNVDFLFLSIRLCLELVSCVVFTLVPFWPLSAPVSFCFKLKVILWWTQLPVTNNHSMSLFTKPLLLGSFLPPLHIWQKHTPQTVIVFFSWSSLYPKYVPISRPDFGLLCVYFQYCLVSDVSGSVLRDLCQDVTSMTTVSGCYFHNNCVRMLLP